MRVLRLFFFSAFERGKSCPNILLFTVAEVCENGFLSMSEIIFLESAAKDARGLALDAIAKAKSGHLGLPLGTAEIGAALFGHTMRLCPDEPRWLGRDRFVLSAGHGSMFLYAWLHLAGFDVTLDDIKSFRQLHSRTPGHPEFRETAGVETTSGPLGQGVANAVGFAISAKLCAARYNTPKHAIFGQTVYALAGDGCLQEGVALEAVALAGHLALDNLVLIYDSNSVTLDAPASASQSADTATYFTACGWDVVEVDGHDIAAVCSGLAQAKACKKPCLVIAKTTIAKGIAEVEGTSKGHGEGGAKFAAEAHAHLGLPEETFTVASETREFFAKRHIEQQRDFAIWKRDFEAWCVENPELANELNAAVAGEMPDLLSAIPNFAAGTNIATRKAGSDVLRHIAAASPLVMGGSADLFGSTLNYIDGGGDFSLSDRSGRNIRFGIREHAMCAILNGIAYDGVFRPSGATFLVFSDYGRPAIRVAALAKLPVTYIFTHDSVAVGEDGPTHEPVESVAALRAIPNLEVIRPADPEETAAAFASAFTRNEGPTALILSRQNLPLLESIPVKIRREGVARGGYIALRETAPLDCIILSCGSELQLALKAAEKLGAGCRVVSMPCFEKFVNQSPEYREEILPTTCRKRISIEAGITQPWYRFVGLDGKAIGIDRFGVSAPGDIALREMGMTVENILEAAK